MMKIAPLDGIETALDHGKRLSKSHSSFRINFGANKLELDDVRIRMRIFVPDGRHSNAKKDDETKFEKNQRTNSAISSFKASKISFS